MLADLKTYRVTGTDHDGQPVALPFATVRAFDAASAKRKALHKLGGFTIGYTVSVTVQP